MLSGGQASRSLSDTLLDRRWSSLILRCASASLIYVVILSLRSRSLAILGDFIGEKIGAKWVMKS